VLLEGTTNNWNRFTSEWKKNLGAPEENNVHGLRVAGRRLIASLRLIEAACRIGPRRSRRRRIKRIVKRLGPLRDLQVHLGILGDATRPSDLAEFRKYLNVEEQKKRKVLQRYLTTERLAKLQLLMEKTLCSASQRLQKVSVTILRCRTKSVIQSQRERLQKARRRMTESNPESLHAVRISAKKLRYLLEAAESVLGRASRDEMRRLRLEQDTLGHVHDLYVARKRYERWTRQSHPQFVRPNFSRRLPSPR